MRCPKCGFISFDHLTSCAKCGKDIADVASELQGTSINVETPMFLSGALAAYAERQESFGDQGMGFDVGEGVDFSMEEKNAVQEPVEMAETDKGVDISFSEGKKDVDISMAEEEEAVDFTIEAEAEAEVVTEPGEAEESFEELDFMGTPSDEEGGLEFDLEDFIDDMDDVKSESASDDDIDIDLDEDEK
jgi:hypothetical protein